MKHITEVLVYKNRCEVVNEHTFGQGDTGIPHIRLTFKYKFECETLRGCRLQCLYLLQDGTYAARELVMENEIVTFPIHYAAFAKGGWTTLRLKLIQGDDVITLDDITIKTKPVKLGELFKNEAVQQAVQIEIDELKTARDKALVELNKSVQKFDELLENKVNECNNNIEKALTNTKQELENTLFDCNKSVEKSTLVLEDKIDDTTASIKKMIGDMQLSVSKIQDGFEDSKIDVQNEVDAKLIKAKSDIDKQILLFREKIASEFPTIQTQLTELLNEAAQKKKELLLQEYQQDCEQLSDKITKQLEREEEYIKGVKEDISSLKIEIGQNIDKLDQCNSQIDKKISQVSDNLSRDLDIISNELQESKQQYTLAVQKINAENTDIFKKSLKEATEQTEKRLHQAAEEFDVTSREVEQRLINKGNEITSALEHSSANADNIVKYLPSRDKMQGLCYLKPNLFFLDDENNYKRLIDHTGGEVDNLTISGTLKVQSNEVWHKGNLKLDPIFLALRKMYTVKFPLEHAKVGDICYNPAVERYYICIVDYHGKTMKMADLSYFSKI